MEIRKISNLVSEVINQNPLVLHYTNEVTINDCANATLAIGASPIMGDAIEEVEDLITISNAVVLNIGKMHSSQIPLYLEAGRIANALQKPIVLDPVGVFASKQRTNFVEELLSKVKFDVIKGNSAEILFMAGLETRGKGVDASDDLEIDINKLRNFSKSIQTTIAATGKTDFITDGERTILIHNGSTKLKSVTGTGCMTASLVGSYLGVTNDPFKAAAMGVLTMSLSGELANHNDPAIGTFKVQLFDEMNCLDANAIENYVKVETL
ncbi:hydroxyethylthiazole kinase [Bacillus massiliigorillae]|uniref:hydroxyethylthiazole kinase n=1 Tax=Bacillus massiliigorillae TaxID=1243664 RepID=UPI0003A7160E|nr:hydroxyethylthiazole kinase [Bacillus massiliigorillae]